MKLHSALICLPCSLLLLFSSCNKKSASFITNDYAEVPQAFSAGRKMVKSAVAENSLMEKAVVYQDADVAEMESSAVQERKVIRNGNITVEVPSLDEVESRLSDFVKNYNGYITNSYINENSFNATIRIPSVHFDEVMDSAGSFGKLKYRSQNGRDVTDDFYDLESRIGTKKILKEKLESYLAGAKDIKDLLEIERQLNSVISELESMEGRMKRMVNQIDYATIYIDMQLPSGYVETGFKWPDVGEKFRTLGFNFVNFLAGALMFIVYLAVFGIPAIFITAFLFWLLFGKLGLLVKLFRKLKDGSNKQ